MHVAVNISGWFAFSSSVISPRAMAHGRSKVKGCIRSWHSASAGCSIWRPPDDQRDQRLFRQIQQRCLIRLSDIKPLQPEKDHFLLLLNVRLRFRLSWIIDNLFAFQLETFGVTMSDDRPFEIEANTDEMGLRTIQDDLGRVKARESNARVFDGGDVQALANLYRYVRATGHASFADDYSPSRSSR